MIVRIFSNTKKHIVRSGWIGWASAFVMTLAFLVITIFGSLAFVSNLFIQAIEQRNNLIVFFNVGVDEEIIQELQTKWATIPEIKEISFTSEEDAYDEYSEYTSQALPEYFQVLSKLENKKLPSSLDIQLNSLDDLSKVQGQLESDINVQLEKLVIIDLPTSTEELGDGSQELGESEPDSQTVSETEDDQPVEESEQETVSPVDTNVTRYKYAEEPGEKPIDLEVDSENLDRQKEILLYARVVLLGVVTLLFLVVSVFLFMTTEFRLYNQREEIGVMQLVGGSLTFIRSPYILEGGFYGLVGALISSGIIGGSVLGLFQNENVKIFIYKNLAGLPWPNVSDWIWPALILLLALVGFVVGSISSYLSIRRYIR